MQFLTSKYIGAAVLCTAFIAGCGPSGDSASTTTGVDVPNVDAPTSAVTPILTIASVKTVNVTWADVADATYYQLLENPDGLSGFTQVGADIAAGVQSIDHIVPLYNRTNASYLIAACNEIGCTDSSTLTVSANINDGIGYFKASNTDADDEFGTSVSLSGDGKTLAVSAPEEDSGFANDPEDDSLAGVGAVYVFVLNDDGNWTQQAYLKPTAIIAGLKFGISVSLSADGNTIAIGAFEDDTRATHAGSLFIFNRSSDDQWTQTAKLEAETFDSGDDFGMSISLSDDGTTVAAGARLENGNDPEDASNDDSANSGAAYVFTLDAATGWSQTAYLKASTIGAQDRFGHIVSLSGDGLRLAVGAHLEDSSSQSDPDDDSAEDSGAVYIFTLNIDGSWLEEAYVKANTIGAGDNFGSSVSLNSDGSILAIGSNREDSNTTSINGDDTNALANNSGAAYVYTRDTNGQWTQEAFIKGSRTQSGDEFGFSIDLSGDGSLLAVGAYRQSSSGFGLNSDELNTDLSRSGAAYTFVRNSGGQWSEQSYIKASNTNTQDEFGYSIHLSNDASTLAIGAIGEDSNAIGITGDQANDDDTADGSGAVYLY